MLVLWLLNVARWSRRSRWLEIHTTTGANFWRKTLLTESYHADATSTLDYDFTANWDHHYAKNTAADYDTTGYHYTGTGEAHRNETFTSHFDVNNKVTTFNTNGTVASVTGTQTWDKTASGTLTRNFDVGSAWERNYQGGYTELYQYNTQQDVGSESLAFSGSWSKNLATNALTTVPGGTNTASGSQELTITYEEWVGDPEDWGYLEIDEPFHDTYTYSYSAGPNNYSTYGWISLSGEHGYNPQDLGTMPVQQQGVLPGNTEWDVGAQGNAENIGEQEPDPVEFKAAEEEADLSDIATRVDQGPGWQHYAWYTGQFVVGAFLIVDGLALAGAGGFVTVGTAGFGSPVTLPAMLVGGVFALEGMDLASNAIFNLADPNNPQMTVTQQLLDESGLTPDFVAYHLTPIAISSSATASAPRYRSQAGPEGIVRTGNKSRVVFDNMEVRAVRDLSHVEESTLREMARKGFAAKDINGKPIVLHHLGQRPVGPLVEMPRFRHNIHNRIQHPLGNATGVGLTSQQRALFNTWRAQYWKARATEELLRRGFTP